MSHHAGWGDLARVNSTRRSPCPHTPPRAEPFLRPISQRHYGITGLGRSALRLLDDESRQLENADRRGEIPDR